MNLRGAVRNSLELTLTAVAIALSCAGCTFTSTCNRDADEFVVTDGIVLGNTYISAPNDFEHRGPWAYFPPARTLVFEHNLGSVPYDFDIWLAFRDQGTLAPAAGNQSIMQSATADNNTISFKNDTCSEFWAWVHASIPVYPSAQSEAGASDASLADPSEAAGASGAP